MSAHALLNLLNELRKKDTMRGLSFISLQDATSYDNYALFIHALWLQSCVIIGLYYSLPKHVNNGKYIAAGRGSL